MAKLSRKQIREGLESMPIEGALFGTAASQAAAARLTPKQREFARLVALGESKAGAYRGAYNSKGKPTTQRSKGYELSQRADIKDTIEAFAQAKVFAEQHTPAQIRAFVIQQLTQHATDNEFPPATRVKALELLGKVAEVGAFVDRKEVVNVQSSQTVRERLMQKLKHIGSGTTGDNTPAPDDGLDLLAEIEQGRIALTVENETAEAPELDAAGAEPTPCPPPAQDIDHLRTYTHTVPHKGSSSDSISDQPSVDPTPALEVIGVDVTVSPCIEVITPIVAEKVAGEDPTPSV